jgi:hypothetical protein
MDVFPVPQWGRGLQAAETRTATRGTLTCAPGRMEPRPDRSQAVLSCGRGWLALLSCQGARGLAPKLAGGRDWYGGKDASEVAAGDVLSFGAVDPDDA